MDETIINLTLVHRNGRYELTANRISGAGEAGSGRGRVTQSTCCDSADAVIAAAERHLLAATEAMTARAAEDCAGH